MQCRYYLFIAVYWCVALPLTTKASRFNASFSTGAMPNIKDITAFLKSFETILTAIKVEKLLARAFEVYPDPFLSWTDLNCHVTLTMM